MNSKAQVSSSKLLHTWQPQESHPLPCDPLQHLIPKGMQCHILFGEWLCYQIRSKVPPHPSTSLRMSPSPASHAVLLHVGTCRIEYLPMRLPCHPTSCSRENLINVANIPTSTTCISSFHFILVIKQLLKHKG